MRSSSRPAVWYRLALRGRRAVLPRIAERMFGRFFLGEHDRRFERSGRKQDKPGKLTKHPNIRRLHALLSPCPASRDGSREQLWHGVDHRPPAEQMQRSEVQSGRQEGPREAQVQGGNALGGKPIHPACLQKAEAQFTLEWGEAEDADDAQRRDDETDDRAPLLRHLGSSARRTKRAWHGGQMSSISAARRLEPAHPSWSTSRNGRRRRGLRLPESHTAGCWAPRRAHLCGTGGFQCRVHTSRQTTVDYESALCRKL